MKQSLFFTSIKLPFLCLALTILPLLNIQGTQSNINSISAKPTFIVETMLPIRNTTDKQAKIMSIKTSHYNILISEKGAEITQLDYIESKTKKQRTINFLKSTPFLNHIYTNNRTYQTMRNAHFTLEKINDTEELITIKASSDFYVLSAQNIKRRVSLAKIITIYKDSHYVTLTFELINKNVETITFPYLIFIPLTEIGPKSTTKNSSSQQSSFSFLHYSTHDDEEFELLGKPGFLSIGGSKNDLQVKQHIDFFGKSSRFLNVTIQPLTQTKAFYYYTASDELHLQLPSQILNPNQKVNFSFLMYIGPKVKDFLKPINLQTKKALNIPNKPHHNIYKSFDFGITAPIRDLVVWLLQLLYYLIPNYGIGIILLSILIKLVFFPLNTKQIKSMKKMNAVQPLIKKINEKHKNDLQERQRQTMALYKEHKINPLGSCLPLLIQIPIFIALYSAFSDSYLLWHSPFISGWINDLSEPDTIYILKNLPFISTININILPIMMGISQYIQMKVAPTTATTDKNQQKIMQLLPLFFLIFFWNLPSGVVLYWTVQNILTILQQQWISYMSLESKDKEEVKKS